jgi:hypothetical protein
MIIFRAVVASIFVLYGGFAYADILFNGRLDEGNFTRYISMEANGVSHNWKNIPPLGIRGHLEKAIDPAGSGKLELRSTIAVGDARTNGGFRSEVSAPKDPIGSERWYSWGYYLPETFRPATNHDMIIAQFQTTADANESTSRRPALSLWVQGDQLKLINAFDYDRITSPSGTPPIIDIDYGYRELASWSLETNKWTNLALHVKWAGDDTGFMEVWKDGTLLFRETNHINTFNDEHGVWFKTGVYGFTKTAELISAYSTGVKIGDGGETLQSITTSAVSAVPEPGVYLMMLAGLGCFGFTLGKKHLPSSERAKHT